MRSSIVTFTVKRLSSMLLAAKCFALAITCVCAPSTNAAPMRPRWSGSSPYVSWARPQAGWRRTLITGARITLAPLALASSPIATPTRRSSSGSQVAPRAMPTGNAVAWPARTPRGPSTILKAGMPSLSLPPA